MNEELAFVVSDSSAVDLVLPDIQGKGIVLPSLVRISGLDIVMAIEQHRRK